MPVSSIDKTYRTIENFKELGYKFGLTSKRVCVMVRDDDLGKFILQVIHRDGRIFTRSCLKRKLKPTLEAIKMTAARKKPAPAKKPAAKTSTAAKKRPAKKPAPEAETKKPAARRTAKAKAPAAKPAAKKAPASRSRSRKKGGLPEAGQREGMGYTVFEVCNQMTERTGKKAEREAVVKAIRKKTRRFTAEQIEGRYRKWSRIYNKLNG